MIEETSDRRSLRTRAALHSAFFQLLLDHGYEALKVGAVAERANVGRSTFYEHYRTKHELLRSSISAPFSVLADLIDPSIPTEGVTALLQHFRENRQLARVLLGCPTRPLLSHTLASLIAARLKRHAAAQALIPVEVIARQIADAQLALVDSWVLGRPGLELEPSAAALRRSSVAIAGALCGSST